MYLLWKTQDAKVRLSNDINKSECSCVSGENKFQCKVHFEVETQYFMFNSWKVPELPYVCFLGKIKTSRRCKEKNRRRKGLLFSLLFIKQ